MPAVAIAKVVLALLPFVTSGAQYLLEFVRSVRAAALQTGEWPPDVETAYQERLLAKAEKPEAQPDSPV